MLSTHNSVRNIVYLIVAAVGIALVMVALQAAVRMPLLIASVSWNWAML